MDVWVLLHGSENGFYDIVAVLGSHDRERAQRYVSNELYKPVKYTKLSADDEIWEEQNGSDYVHLVRRKVEQ